MKTLRYLLLSLAWCFALNTAQADPFDQRPRMSPKEFRQKQEAFIIREAYITAAEAEKFFPLFHKMEDEIGKINRQIDNLMLKAGTQKLPQKEYVEILQQTDKLQIKRVKLEASYHTKFQEVLTPLKVLRVIVASKRFDRQILKQMIKRW